MTKKYALIVLIILMKQVFVLANEAQKLYERYQNSIFQIQVIDILSGKKSSIGTAFSVDGDGLFCTNYHVVAELVQEPLKYRIEQVYSNGTLDTLTVIDFDIIHDIALVKNERKKFTPVPLHIETFTKGERLYSLGNPMNLGLTIVEGSYNGYMEKSLYERMLFSGAINKGMSGGPCINKKGEVVGINVATAGNQISFIIPAKFLALLLDNIAIPLDKSDQKEYFHRKIENQLFVNQKRYIDLLLSQPFDIKTVGPVCIPLFSQNIFESWGKSLTQKDSLYSQVYTGNYLKDDIYICSDFQTGKIYYRFDWFQTKKINQFRLYNVIEKKFIKSINLSTANEKYITSYSCIDEFVQIDSKKWKVIMCARQYKQYPTLYDITLKYALVSEKSESVVIEIVLNGISKNSGLKVLSGIMEAMVCQN